MGRGEVMPIPFDSKLTKLRILRRRAQAKHKAALEALQESEYRARLEDEELLRQFEDRCKELGYCPSCEVPENECKGHVWLAE